MQIQAKDESGVVSKPLEERFQQGLDAISMFDGSSGSDDYLIAWEWSEYTEMEGAAEEVAVNLAERFNKRFPQDFVARVRDLHQAGQRDSRPGAVDHWMD